MTENRPLILVTNDDGITAPGIRHLIDIVKDFGDVVVVAPDAPQSGMGHAVTITSMIYLAQHKSEEGIVEYSCSGTPADCVKIAKHELLQRKPDLCVSGINHGSNASINVVYSGTMGATIEAGIDNIPAIGFSLLDYSWSADFSQSTTYIKKIIAKVLEEGLPTGVVLNVNIPNLKSEEIKGIKICRQARGRWQEKYDKRTTPLGKDYYWLTGEYFNEDFQEDTDLWVLENGYVSVVPTKFDLTAHHSINELNDWKLD